jgi:hypothetical protein
MKFCEHGRKFNLSSMQTYLLNDDRISGFVHPLLNAFKLIQNMTTADILRKFIVLAILCCHMCMIRGMPMQDQSSYRKSRQSSQVETHHPSYTNSRSAYGQSTRTRNFLSNFGQSSHERREGSSLVEMDPWGHAIPEQFLNQDEEINSPFEHQQNSLTLQSLGNYSWYKIHQHEAQLQGGGGSLNPASDSFGYNRKRHDVATASDTLMLSSRYRHIPFRDSLHHPGQSSSLHDRASKEYNGEKSKGPEGLALEAREDKDSEDLAGKNVYNECDKQTRWQLKETLHLRTGLLKASLGKKLASKMTVKMRDIILSNDSEEIERVIDELFKEEAERFRHYEKQKWMINMDVNTSKIVVRKMAVVSGWDDEHIRNFFLRTQVSPETAKMILEDTTSDVCKSVMVEMGLDCPFRRVLKRGDKRSDSKTIEVWPWMRGLTESQKSQAISKMMSATGLSKDVCYRLLRQPHAKEDLGFNFLVSHPLEIKAEVEALIRTGAS